MTSDDRSSYVLGDSRGELERLERQGRFYAPSTQALFAAGSRDRAHARRGGRPCAMPAVTRAEPEGYTIMASLMRTLAPMLVQAGIMGADEIGIDTLERRLIEEVSAKGHIYIWSPLVGAWSRKP
jgi:hypothetical protein